MNISFYTSWHKKCGITDYSSALVQALEDRGMAVAVVPVRDDKRAALFLDDGNTMNNAHIAHIQHEYSFFSNSRFPFLYPLLSAWHFYLLAKQITIPKFITLHELGSWTGRSALMRFLGFFFWKTYSAILNKFRRIIVHTKYFRDILVRNGIDEHRVLFIPHPVPLLKVPIDAMDPGARKFKGSLAPEGNTILTIFGFVNARKGYEVALSAVKELSNCSLLIAGGPQPGDESGYAEHLRNTIAALNLEGKVTMLGFLPEPELHRVMLATDMFLAPFIDAAASGSLSRVMAYQKPIVGSDIATIRELKDMGLGIELFPAGESAHLTDTVRRLLNDKDAQRHLTERTAEFIRRFSYDGFAGDLMTLYEREIRT